MGRLIRLFRVFGKEKFSSCGPGCVERIEVIRKIRLFVREAIRYFWKPDWRREGKIAQIDATTSALASKHFAVIAARRGTKAAGARFYCRFGSETAIPSPLLSIRKARLGHSFAHVARTERFGMR
jgi:hypothetical protein